jgi:hypothetical protein
VSTERAQGINTVGTVDIRALPEGSLIEVQPADAFPEIHPAPAHEFLCADSQLRLVTTANGTQLYGAPTRDELRKRLHALGFKPIDQI